MSVCGREKCALKRKPYPPGIHGKAFRKGGSEYGLQLKEKQKIKFLYGLRERQFKNYVAAASSQRKMPTGDAVLLALETRLDNTVFRSGFASTRRGARQMVGHGHILLNGRRVNIPSYKVKIGDEIRLHQRSIGSGLAKNLPTLLKKYNPPEWISLDKQTLSAKILFYPSTAELMKFYNINAIVEYYSR